MPFTEAQLTANLQSLLPSGAIGRVRRIQANDATYFTPIEAEHFAKCIEKVQRASGAARHLARQLLHERSIAPIDFIPASDGRPLWPTGIVGSLTHDRYCAAAAIATASEYRGIGIDVEPNTEINPDLARVILRDDEREPLRQAGLSLHQAFSIKEAVFKAAYPIDLVRIGFHDIHLEPHANIAHTSAGRELTWRTMRHPVILSTAWLANTNFA